MPPNDLTVSDGPFFVGLISGTSADGIDAAVVDFSHGAKLVGAQTFSYSASVRERLLAIIAGQYEPSLVELGRLDAEIAEEFAQAASNLISQSGLRPENIAAIGSHGQTIKHHPQGPHPFTMQIGDPNIIAERTGITTIADFRRRDMAAGGQGAPLVPAFHAHAFADATRARAVLNLGGIANFTFLPNDGRPVLGFDTGPANCLIDSWVQTHFRMDTDIGGKLARQGKAIDALIAHCLQDGYFSRPPPKSTGREYFNMAWLREKLKLFENTDPIDVLATLVDLSANSVAGALRDFIPAAEEVVVCGGGAHNAYLLERLQHALDTLPVRSSADYGLNPDFIEAMAFAWLARQTLAGNSGNIPSVTGAKCERVLGGIYLSQHTDRA